MVYSFGFYAISKKNFQNFQKIELWSPVKGSRPLLPPKLFARYITQALSKNIFRFINISKEKKKNFLTDS